MTAPDERRARLAAARLYLVIEAAPARSVVPAALAGGVDVVQLRDKHAPDSEVVEAGRWLRDSGALFVINDRPDLALECGADGVHVGQDDMPVDEVRSLVGPDVLIGLSTHSPMQVDAAIENPDVDYLGVGPVWETTTKPGRAAVGLELVEHAAGAAASKSWFAIGGIDAERAPQVVEAGAERLAVVRAVRDAADPRAAARMLREAIDMERVGGQAQ
jgi:thiamine-phosphate pyrophosphorylase